MNAPAGLPAQFELAAGFAERVAGWARARGAGEAALAALATAAQRLCLASAAGHVCLPLAAIAVEVAPEWGEDDAGWDEQSALPWDEGADPAAVAALRSRLLESGAVVAAADLAAAAHEAHPLVLDADDRLYLRRLYDLEGRLAQALRTRAEAAPGAVADERVRALLAPLFPAPAGEAPDWQRIAVALALGRRLTVISGGPGTGKTTTVAALLGALLGLQPQARIALAAPTGKAAARMLEALRGRAASLPAALRAALPGEAHTVHRLLGVTPQPGRFRHHAGNPLPVDVLVVDEASMLDLALAARLLDALPPEARLVLLGDKDQLAAVEAGAVFAEVSAARALDAAEVARLAALTGCSAAAMADELGPPAGAAGALAGSVVWLTRSHRFAADSGIGRLAADINGGRGETALAWLAAGADPSARWLDDGEARPGAALWQAMETGYAPYLAALRESAAQATPPARAVATAFAAFDRFRVLAAVHDGPRGLGALNAHLARWLRAQLAHPLDRGAGARWYPGRAVIVLRNDYLLGLYNGDVGLCLPDADGTLAVWFALQGGGFRALPPQRLPAHDDAFALTIHKSQGSEFEEVLVVLPAQPVRVLSRELLYTGVTRAAQRVCVAGGAAVFAAACERPTRRHSGLAARLGADRSPT
ncbi:exodeoxyribonuclease V subunit alpha [Azoarcus olearius]|uniref:RecBCD enzyme subunit RecD n=1 Tax=Azoarcus sp. (strain BH72) TaxID=418699 RepID=A1KCB0_AZOSB|nr:exodeoxyribonuclease V subunit alpha [Azoarcus olearius]CAL96466.1 DNA helicase, ATP-dependent dsDNA/ssDNA exonuclease V subunit, ssDNA endonuclease [Azoarcus olearius]